MHYPIFKSIVNKIETGLSDRGINTKKFKVWQDNKIKATGLEILIDVSKSSNYVEEVSINFDWDVFREAKMAKKLEGLEKHPALKLESIQPEAVDPFIDVELSWNFNTKQCNGVYDLQAGEQRNERSIWMDKISRALQTFVKDEEFINRWHFEIDGTSEKRSLSAIVLISYFQYSLSHLKTLTDTHIFVSRRLQDLLLKSNRLLFEAEKILSETAAA